jgi:4-diphosphocytidyl-2-C-methyl-D-erythritol kinase
MKELKVKSYAKINIGLTVVRKRPDGYHDIESIFYPINLHDDIEISESDSFKFECNVKEIENTENLIIKTIKLIESESEQKFNVKIKLIKKIPLGAGLGGGSSNAAAIITSLNSLYNLGLSSKEQIKIAEKIGSDVLFFLNSKPALVTSKGEIIKPINLRIDFPILIINPNINISTKWAYENVKPSGKERILEKIIKNDYLNIYKWRNEIQNDFEEIVFKNYPQIEDIKNKLYESGAIFSLMTGTGSTVFGIFEDLQAAEKAKNLFDKNYFTFINLSE